ncbi:MAG TPA: hypothetical protein PKA64_05860, partial [Myxococcota bacterium]|nr:hypothetical protein [Myxococcota bacterium]
MDSKITCEVSLFDYFHRRVDDARAEGRVRLTDDAGLYLAQMLADRARMDRDAPRADTLAELHAQACHAAPAEQARTWRELGDRALYDLGTFKEHLERRVVPLSYYEAMGSAAYERVDAVLKRWFSNAFGELFQELAARFHDCVRVLDAVRSAHDEDQVDRLYEAWAAT